MYPHPDDGLSRLLGLCNELVLNSNLPDKQEISEEIVQITTDYFTTNDAEKSYATLCEVMIVAGLLEEFRTMYLDPEISKRDPLFGLLGRG